MCGLIASLVAPNHQALHTDDWFRESLIASQVRGLDSTGIFQLARNGQVYTAKAAQNASTFIRSNSVARGLIVDACKEPLTVGHVRAATQGGVVDANAHPFKVEREDKSYVVGVHNGTLKGWKDKEGGKDQDVDSAWAFNVFAKEGPVDAFEYFNGAFAFIWFDSRFPDHVWMARNDERPLHFFLPKDGKEMLVASELGMLGWLSQKHGYKPQAEGNSFFWLNSKKIYKFNLKKIGEYDELDRPEYDPSTTIKAPSYSTVPAHAYNRGGASNDDIPFGSTTGTGSGSTRTTERFNQRPNFNDWFKEQPTLKAIKEALAKARRVIDAEARGVVPDEEIITNDSLDMTMENRILEQEMKNALEDFKQKLIRDDKKPPLDIWKLIDTVYMADGFNTRGATGDEIKRAAKMKMLGRFLPFNGVLYDDDNAEYLGESYLKPVNGDMQVHDMLIRGLSKAAAQHQFGEEIKPMIVIGVMDGILNGELCFIVASPNKAQVEKLERQIGYIEYAS